jgi:hypothetical protein
MQLTGFNPLAIFEPSSLSTHQTFRTQPMEIRTRLVNRTKNPDARQVAEWIGPRAYRRWLDLTRFIENSYPRVFETTWLFGGNKYGWVLRFKKSKSFCSLIPERGRLCVLLVFGAEERAKVEELLPSLTPHVQEVYRKSRTFHDGRWVSLPVDNAKVVSDIRRLLMLKRKPKAPRKMSSPAGKPASTRSTS